MSVSIALMIEGRTERAFLAPLRAFLGARLAGRMPSVKPYPYNGRLPKGEWLARDVRGHLKRHDHVIALTDVYTGNDPRDFQSANDARARMRAWVGGEPCFHPHAAQFEFEAWLIPYWPRIQALANSTRAMPGAPPDTINHDRPPSRMLREMFQTGRRRVDYQKVTHATAILRDQDLSVAARECPELRAFLNTILTVSGGVPI